MKTILKITALCILLCHSNLNAQETQKWYADDIYYDAGEKNINYVQIVIHNYDDEASDNLSDSYENSMSYSMRINRFHRNYYGSSLSFNYGYFHDPYIYNGFGHHAYAYDPFYHYGWNTPYYNWHHPYYGHQWYNDWHSPGYYNHQAWHNPYYYKHAYYYDTDYTSSKKIHYGPRKSTGSNVSSKTINNRSDQGRGMARMANPKPHRNRVIKSDSKEKKSSIPKNIRSLLENSNTTKKNSETYERPLRGNESKSDSKTKLLNTRSKETFRPLRNATGGNTKTNQRSTAPRRTR